MHERIAVREIIGREREMRPKAIEDDGRKWTRNRGIMYNNECKVNGAA
jgi:hypothetical protein